MDESVLRGWVGGGFPYSLYIIKEWIGAVRHKRGRSLNTGSQAKEWRLFGLRRACAAGTVRQYGWPSLISKPSRSISSLLKSLSEYMLISSS